MEGPVGPAAAAYAAALRTAVKRYTDTGRTQGALAKKMHISASSLSRYLSGHRLAPPKILHAMKTYLEAQTLSFPDGFWEELDVLCAGAHQAAETPTAKVVQLREELRRAEQRLDELERRAGHLAGEVEQALVRAQGAEAARLFLQTRVTEQDRSLRKARDYIHRIEAELAEYKDRAAQHVREVEVLREQNLRLIEAEPAVPAPATQLSYAGDSYTPDYAPPAFGSSPADGYQWPPPPRVLLDFGPAEQPCAAYPGQGSWGCRHWPPCAPARHEPFPYDPAAILPGYLDQGTTSPYPSHDEGYDTWALDLSRYAGRTAAAGPHPPADKKPPPAAPPTPSAHQDDKEEEELQPMASTRRSHAAPPRPKDLLLPDVAFLLLTVLITSLLYAVAVISGKITTAAWNPS
ncbi:hypothetical protein [Streptomyces sp. NPDC017949]|uniref:hypothetical protein n=1 Tax=Streptomyces sp. NPDC017949 TaxID=3365020 RepID=UPI00378D1821